MLTSQALTAILLGVRHFWKQPRGIWNPRLIWLKGGEAVQAQQAVVLGEGGHGPT
jgi:predicted glycosyl hydrolase (DUF1957 family)